jgi:hypothetical protein
VAEQCLHQEERELRASSGAVGSLTIQTIRRPEDAESIAILRASVYCAESYN